MRTLTAVLAAALAVLSGCERLAYGSSPARQPLNDLLIYNVRIVSVDHHTVERGSILIRRGRIVAVAAGSIRTHARRMIDASGFTALPGFIDVHVHLLEGPQPKDISCGDLVNRSEGDLHNLLSHGFTTVMDAGDLFPASAIIKARVDSGELTGPRIRITGPTFVHPDYRGAHRPGFCDAFEDVTDIAEARTQITAQAAAGVNGISIVDYEDIPPRLDESLVRGIVRQARALHLPVLVQGQSRGDAMRALAAGADRLMHVPITPLSRSDIAQLKSANVAFATTVHLFWPIESADGRQLNHSGREITSGFDARNQRQAIIAANLRALIRAGVVVAFGTDRYRGNEAVEQPAAHEIQTLAKILTPTEIVATLTKNAAKFLDLDQEIGSLDVGKRADVVLVKGNPEVDPLLLSSAVSTVIANGRIVIDRRH